MQTADEQLLDLLDRVCGQCAGEADLLRLAELLEGDPQARRVYMQYMDLHASLCKRGQMPPYTSAPRIPPVRRPAILRDHTAGETAPVAEVARLWSTTKTAQILANSATGNSVRFRPARLAAVSLVLTCAVWALFFFWVDGLRLALGPGHAPAPVELGPPAARVTRAWDPVWKQGRPGWIPDAPIRPGGALHLETGRVEVAFLDGATVMLQGPATLRVLSENRGRLDLGRLAARVAPGAEGFTVEVEQLEIVDLGTAFAVVHVPGRATEVAVQKGAVELRAAPGATDGLAAPRRIEAGDVVRIDHTLGGAQYAVRSIDKLSPQLVQELPAPAGGGSDAYARAVRASGPIAYWRLDDEGRNRFRDASGNEQPVPLGPHVQVGVRGLRAPGLERSNLATGFSGHAIPEARLRSDTLHLGERYSVEMWLRNTRPFDQQAVTGYVFSSGLDDASTDSASNDDGEHLGLGGRWLKSQQRLVFYNGEEQLFGKTRLTLGRWHHVVLTRDGDQIAVYLDGGESPEISGTMPRSVPAGLPVFIGGRSDSLFNFCGQIDEVAFYDRALTPAEIKRHVQAALGTADTPAAQAAAKALDGILETKDTADVE